MRGGVKAGGKNVRGGVKAGRKNVERRMRIPEK